MKYSFVTSEELFHITNGTIDLLIQMCVCLPDCQRGTQRIIRVGEGEEISVLGLDQIKILYIIYRLK